MTILDKLFAAADNHGEDTGDGDHAFGDLQDLLRAAWKIFTPAQQRLLLGTEEVANLVEAGARDEFTVEDLAAELDAPTALLNTVKVVVLCSNSSGELELHTCAPEATSAQIADGDHYDFAKQNAEFNSFEGPMIAFDGTDPAARQLIEVASWLRS